MATQYFTAASLNGFIATPDHCLDWLMQFPDGPGDTYEKFIANVGALAMGGNTYRWLLKHLEANPGPWPYQQPCWVFTNQSLAPVPGAEIHFVSGDPRPVHAAMSAAVPGKNIWLVGGGELVGQFHDHGLLDEIHIQIAAVTLAAGTPLLPRSIVTPPLELQDVHRRGAFAELVYKVPRP